MIIHINDGQKLSFQFFKCVEIQVLTLVKQLNITWIFTAFTTFLEKTDVSYRDPLSYHFFCPIIFFRSFLCSFLSQIQICKKTASYKWEPVQIAKLIRHENIQQKKQA